MKQRNQLLDVAKGVAIILVVLGHAIQNSGSNTIALINLPIERFIVSFHMPLFMLISGYLFYYTMQRHSVKDIIRNRMVMFSLPIFTVFVIKQIRCHIRHLDTFIADIPKMLFGSLWFFWAMLLLTLLMCLIETIGKGKWYTYLLIIGLTLFLPDNKFLRLYIFLLPVFAVGFIACKHKNALTLLGGVNLR